VDGHAAGLALTEVAGVDQQPLFTALHPQHEFGDGHVGQAFDRVADLAVDRVDPAGEFDFDGLVFGPFERDRQVGQLVIGGVAVAAHGYVRGTADLDLVPDPDPENLKRLTEALERLESTLPTVGGRAFDPASDARVVRRGGNVSAETKFGGLDVVQRARGVPSYTQLAEDAVQSELLGVPVLVCSLARLREMKKAQGRALDRADLENLPKE
jgi:hypothetical protein